MKKNKKEKMLFKQSLLNNIYIIKMAYKICRKRIYASFIYTTIRYVMNFYFSIIFTALIFKGLEGTVSFDTIALLIGINVTAWLLFEILYQIFYEKYVPFTDILIKEQLNLMIFEKAHDVEIECYEDADYYNKYTRAASDANDRVIKIVNDMSNIVGLLISLVMIVITIIALDPFAMFFIIIPLTFRFFVDVRRNKVAFNRNQENTPYERRKGYVKRILYLEDYAKEIRITNIFSILNKNYNDGVDGLIKNYKKYGFKIATYKALLDGIEGVVRFPLIVIYSAVRILIHKILTPASFMVMINSINKLMLTFSEFSSYITRMQENGLYIQNFKDFMEYIPKISQSQQGIICDGTARKLELKDVYFSYKDFQCNSAQTKCHSEQSEESYILKNINITINKGEKIALVGANGSGKTTLIKLIMRFYDCSSGEVLLNGENVKEYNVEKYRDMYGTIFQDYKLFSMSVSDNVLMKKSNKEDKAIVEKALRESGIYQKVMENPKGLEQVLTREFCEDGLVLSGGEYQKLAIARVFAKPCDIVIMDEPSSALDPLAEYHMFENMKKVCKDKTVIFISHRLSSAINADRIYMMEEGRIIESGTHTQLIKENGKYAEMFIKQSQMYLGGM